MLRMLTAPCHERICRLRPQHNHRPVPRRSAPLRRRWVRGNHRCGHLRTRFTQPRGRGWILPDLQRNARQADTGYSLGGRMKYYVELYNKGARVRYQYTQANSFRKALFQAPMWMNWTNALVVNQNKMARRYIITGSGKVVLL